MTRWFITPDLHGERRLADLLLRAAGVPYNPWTRKRRGIVSVQLGDLANCTARTRDADERLLTSAFAWCDVVLVGNHEHPYFGGPRFAGFHPFPEVEEGLRALEQLGILRPCLLAGDVLLTHAGATPDWGFATAEEAADRIESAWWGRGRDWALFSQIGHARGGWVDQGSVLWSDFRHELRADFRQIHGHTPSPDGPMLFADGRYEQLRTRWAGPLPQLRRLPSWALNLDVGGGKNTDRLAGAWLDEDGTVEIVECRESP